MPCRNNFSFLICDCTMFPEKHPKISQSHLFFSDNTKMQYTNMVRQHLYLRYKQSTKLLLAESYEFNTIKVVFQDMKYICLGKWHKTSVTHLTAPTPSVLPIGLCLCPYICDYCGQSLASRVYSAKLVISCSDHLSIQVITVAAK